MKNAKIVFCALALILALTIPLVGQERARAASDERGGGRDNPGGGSPSSSGGVSSISSRGIAAGASATSSVTGTSRDSGGQFSSIGPGNSSGLVSVTPDLRGTSYTSSNVYYEAQDFYWRLRMHYGFSPFYFRRFSRNVEPLITPELMRLTLREPLGVSARLVTAVNDLEVMLTDHEAGKTVDKKELEAKIREIRDLAKKIRADQTLAYVDRREEKDLAKGNQFDALGLQAIGQLREMVTDLHNQLKGMYSQTATSTISVQSLTQPSLGSLSKGIEKLSKVIENSARRL